MNLYLLMLGALIILIPNAVFGLWLVWSELNYDGVLTRKGQRYVTVTFTLIAGVLITALMGIVGYIETSGV
jgi:heme A synthase